MNWISVKERLPEVGEPVLMYIRPKKSLLEYIGDCVGKTSIDTGCYMEFGRYGGKGFIPIDRNAIDFDFKCTHWISRKDIPKP